MVRHLMFGLALVLAAMLTLQGCGGDTGGSSTPAPSPGTVTTTVITTTTTVTKARGPSGLYWCEDIDTFYKAHYDQNGTKTASGQCLPSKSPGAYYTTSGEKAEDNKSDRMWSCFSPDFKKSLWTDEEAQKTGFAGACLFRDFGNQTNPSDVHLCSSYLSHNPAVCAPGPKVFWGACWSSRSENWKCIPHNDATIPGLADGDCKAAVVPEGSAPTDYFFDGVCRFEEDTEQLYKCDTVPGYSESTAGTCGQKVNTKDDEACFTLKSGVVWQCMQAQKCLLDSTAFAPDMPGQGRTKEKSAAKCQARCASVQGCEHFSFWPDGDCHLQNSTSKPFAEAKVISGPPICPQVQCDWTLLPGETTEFYKGYCVFPKSSKYINATDAHNLTATSLIV